LTQSGMGRRVILLKNTNARELVDMLSDLDKDEMPLSPGLAARLLKEFKQIGIEEQKRSLPSMEQTQREQLTRRQVEILEMVARGLTYKEAGDALGLTERTLKYHMNRIIGLLHLENRSQVIAYAARMGIIKDKETGAQ